VKRDGGNNWYVSVKPKENKKFKYKPCIQFSPLDILLIRKLYKQKQGALLLPIPRNTKPVEKYFFLLTLFTPSFLCLNVGTFYYHTPYSNIFYIIIVDSDLDAYGMQAIHLWYPYLVMGRFLAVRCRS